MKKCLGKMTDKLPMLIICLCTIFMYFDRIAYLDSLETLGNKYTQSLKVLSTEMTSIKISVDGISEKLQVLEDKK